MPWFLRHRSPPSLDHVGLAAQSLLPTMSVVAPDALTPSQLTSARQIVLRLARRGDPIGVQVVSGGAKRWVDPATFDAGEGKPRKRRPRRRNEAEVRSHPPSASSTATVRQLCSA